MTLLYALAVLLVAGTFAFIACMTRTQYGEGYVSYGADNVSIQYAIMAVVVMLAGAAVICYCTW